MKKLLTFFVVIAGLSMAAAPLLAHHGHGTIFEPVKENTLKGTISQVNWRNPHVLIFMDVKGEDGKVVTWSFEQSGTSNLAQAGYNRNTVRVGQEVIAVFKPARNGQPVGDLIKFMSADGKTIMSHVGGGDNPLD